MTVRDYFLWLRDQTLPRWSSVGFDEDRALFFERLNMDATPDRDADLRLRTHMRQVYVFAHAGLLGLAPREPSLSMARRGMDKARAIAWAPDGRPGWAHRLSPDGRVLDARRDLYDHAFVLHALAWVAKATGEPVYRGWIDETLAAIDELMAAPAGGWAESDQGELQRRQNPHMHLLEACLALYETTGEARHLARAGEIVGLFASRFFDEETKTLREFFGPFWQLTPELGADRLDPGHMMEWVWLLRRYSRSSGKPVDRLCAELFASGKRLGLERESGFLLDEVSLAGKPLSNGRRLWPQTEYLKALLVQREATGERSYAEEADRLTDRLFASYLAGPVPGTWIDRFTLDGKPSVDHVPASILYHLLVPAVEMLRLDPTLANAPASSR